MPDHGHVNGAERNHLHAGMQNARGATQSAVLQGHYIFLFAPHFTLAANKLHG